MNFPEDVPNSSQSFMSFVDQVYYFFKTCTYSLFIYTISTKLFVPSAISIFLFCIFVLGRKQNWLFNPRTEKALIYFMLNKK